jgi:hypothetical protein
MTIQMTQADVMAAVEGLAWAGSIAAMLIVGLLIYLMVRPRRPRDAPPQADALDADEMLRLIDRMERRLEVLERAVAGEGAGTDRVLEADEGPDMRRSK